MRDIGYSFEAALADLVDNSITAAATRVSVMFSAAGGRPHLAIIDDGWGMSGQTLTEAMQLGFRNPVEVRAADDLGRFGLGLKTASFSQCRRLSVVSRVDGATEGRQWDLARIAESGEWYLRNLSPAQIAALPEIASLGKRGTIVIWEDMDRVRLHHEGASLEEGLNSIIATAQKHLELVFHRFLSGEAGRKISISINGHALKPFDPFGRSHKATQTLPLERIRVAGAEVQIQPYTLPHHSRLTEREYEDLGGEEGYLRSQGFYVYRSQRLIIHGTWFRLVRQSELTKLARVQVDIPNTLDHLWTIDVKKSRAAPPEPVRRELKRVIDQITGRSERVYTHRGRKITSDGFVHVWDRVSKHGQIRYEINRTHPLVESLRRALAVAESDVFEDVIRLVESSIPTDALYADLAGHRPSLAAEPEQDWKTLLARLAAAMVEALRAQDLPPAEIAHQMLSTEPFCRNRDESERLLREWGIMP